MALGSAELTGGQEVWKTALEGVNVRQSAVVNAWKAEAKIEGIQGLLTARLGGVSADVAAKLAETRDLAHGHELFKRGNSHRRLEPVAEQFQTLLLLNQFHHLGWHNAREASFEKVQKVLTLGLPFPFGLALTDPLVGDL